MGKTDSQELFNKIKALSPEKAAVVEAFVDFLQFRGEDRGLVKSMAKLSERAFQEVWDNSEDAVYDNL